MSAVEQLVICTSSHNKLKLSGLCRELITKTVERKYVTYSKSGTAVGLEV